MPASALFVSVASWFRDILLYTSTYNIHLYRAIQSACRNNASQEAIRAREGGRSAHPTMLTWAINFKYATLNGINDACVHLLRIAIQIHRCLSLISNWFLIGCAPLPPHNSQRCILNGHGQCVPFDQYDNGNRNYLWSWVPYLIFASSHAARRSPDEWPDQTGWRTHESWNRPAHSTIH